MTENKRFLRATWQIMEQLLEVDRIEDALTGGLEIIIKELKSEAGAIWLLDKKTNRLLPLFFKGTEDLSGISIENGTGIEGKVVTSGEAIMIADAAKDPRYEGSVFDSRDFSKKKPCSASLSTICARPLAASRCSTSRTERPTTRRSCSSVSAWQPWRPSPLTRRGLLSGIRNRRRFLYPLKT